MKTVRKGYKVLSSDYTCKSDTIPRKYHCPGVVEDNLETWLSDHCMTFCETLEDCFLNNDFDRNSKVVEVIASGSVVGGTFQSYADKLEIVRELSWDEVLRIIANRKSYSRKYLDGVVGLIEGWCNNTVSNKNTITEPKGHIKQITDSKKSTIDTRGNYNTGKDDIVDQNTGNLFEYNPSNFSVGCFNTTNPSVRCFDQEVDMSLEEWRQSEAYRLLQRIETCICVDNEDATAEERCTTSNTEVGSLKSIDFKEVAKKWWDTLNAEEREVIKSIPNFDSKKFYKITGIKVKDLKNLSAF